MRIPDTSTIPEHILTKMPVEERKRLGKVARIASERTADNSIRLERELHKLIQNELTRRGIYYVHSRCDKRTTQAAGVPDFIFAINGKAIAIEVKMPGNKLSEEQVAAIEQMRLNGWMCWVCYDFESVSASLKNVLYQ